MKTESTPKFSPGDVVVLDNNGGPEEFDYLIGNKFIIDEVLSEGDIEDLTDSFLIDQADEDVPLYRVKDLMSRTVFAESELRENET